MEKTKRLYILPTLAKHHYTITSFDLWVSKVKHDIFALVTNFLIVDWQSKHITLGLFEATNINGQTLAKNLTDLLDNYALRRKIMFMLRMRDLI
jgi:hypothetical protein